MRPLSAWNHFDPDVVNGRLEAGVDEAYLHGQRRARRCAYLQPGLAFHECLLGATHNQFIAGLAPVISALLRVSFRVSVRSLAGARASLPADRCLLNPIIAREPGMAEAATYALIESARADIEDRIGSNLLTAAEPHA